MLNANSFKPDPEEGLCFVARVPESHATFMGLPMTVVTGYSSIVYKRLPPKEVARANVVMKYLPELIREAEKRLLEYANESTLMITTSDDIQNPHIWLNAEAESDAQWTIVVEMKDNDGYSWLIEFNGAEFRELWSAS